MWLNEEQIKRLSYLLGKSVHEELLLYEQNIIRELVSIMLPLDRGMDKIIEQGFYIVGLHELKRVLSIKYKCRIHD